MKEIYSERRRRLMKNRQGPCAVCIFSGRAPMRSADENYPFSVDRSFFYLTGIDRDNMILVLRLTHDGAYSEQLFILPYDDFLAKWVGGRMRAEEAAETSGVEDIRDLGTFHECATSWLDTYRGMGTEEVFLDLWRYREDQADTPALEFARWLQRHCPAVRISEIFGDLAAMRAVKSEPELALMRKAQVYTCSAIIEMMRHTRPGMNETEIEGAFDFGLMKQGCREHAFGTITAGGKRATTLHYSDNNCVVEDGELVQVDLGGAEQHYCADISRAFPANGRFTARQKEIYNTVLEAQRIVKEAAKPGVTMRQLNDLVIEYYESRLDDLGLRKDGKGVRDYYYHSVTHSLGLDCHDVCTQRERTLQAGMVITDEPGLYIEDEGIGIRIEDDLLITEDGAVDLSEAIPKTVEEIEAVMAER